MDSKQIIQIVFCMAGGLSLFIFGMNLMSESLQKLAGQKMKAVLGALTKNPVLGVLAGAIVTMVLQSSSATTVLIIGFVSAGLISLPQGISVIFGANIGTTVTAQIIAFKISDYIWPILAMGFLTSFLARREKLKNAGLAIFAFGILFVGIETMGEVMKPLAKSAAFISMMQKVSGFPALGVLVGTLMTVIVQSSSATIAVLQNFAQQPGADGVSSIIGLYGAISILLGDNIGTTITALLASIGQSRDAKRVAVAHSVFNIAGAFLFVWIIPFFANFIRLISPKGIEVQIISRQIANAHMTFNIFNTILWLPLIPLMVRIVNFIVRGNEDKKTVSGQITFFDKKILAQPSAAIILIQKQMQQIFLLTEKSIDALEKCFSERNISAFFKVQKTIRKVRELDGEISKYISQLFSAGTMTELQSTHTAAMLCIMNDTTRINYRCEEVIPIAKEFVERNIKFSESTVKEILESMDKVKKIFQLTSTALTDHNFEMAQQIISITEKFCSLERKLTKNHLKRIGKKLCKPESMRPFTIIIHGIMRIAILCASIAEEILDTKNIENI